MVIGVLGGTGQTGTAVTAELARRGHRAIVLARGRPAAGEHRRVDVVSGEGLAAAMDGLEALAEVLDGDEAVLVGGVRRALAAARAAGVGHVVSLSAAGAGRVPLGYYRIKAAQEALVRESGVPFSIVRAAQFHPFVAGRFAAAARRGVLPLLRAPIEPVAVAEVAAGLADRVEAGPDGALTELAGPRVERLDALARSWARIEGVRRLPLPVPAVGAVLRGLRSGGLLAEAPIRGRVAFADWLADPRAAAG